MANTITKNEDTNIKVPYTVTIDGIKEVNITDINLIIRKGKALDIAKIQYGHAEPPEYDKREVTKLLAIVDFIYQKKLYKEVIFISELVAVLYNENGEIEDFTTDVEITDPNTVNEIFIDNIISSTLEDIIYNIDLKNSVEMTESKVKNFNFVYPTDI